MILTLKSRIAGIVLLLFIANTGLAQWSDGPFLSIGAQGGIPLNAELKKYSWAAGGIGKFSIPVGDKEYFTLTMNALSINGAYKGKNLKERDILSGMVGFRYDFRTEDSYSYFFMEPQIGWTFVGTDYNSFSYMPNVGYSLNDKIDLSLWYHVTTSQLVRAKIATGGLLVTYNFHFGRRTE